MLIELTCRDCGGKRHESTYGDPGYTDDNPRCHSCAMLRLNTSKRIKQMRPVLRDLMRTLNVVHKYIQEGEERVSVRGERWTYSGRAVDMVASIEAKLSGYIDDKMAAMLEYDMPSSAVLAKRRSSAGRNQS